MNILDINMAKTIPLINGHHIDKNWNLDDNGDLTELGFPTGIPCKKVDRYAHYRNCPHALIEFTKSAISKAVIQFQECAGYLMQQGKSVDRLILVVDRWSKREKNRFAMDNKKRVLCDKESNKPIIVECSDTQLEIFIYTEEQAQKTHSLRR